VRQLAPGNGEDIVLLLARGVGAVDQSRTAKEFHSRRQESLSAVADAGDIAEFESLVMAGSGKDLLELGIHHD
jgi:hypothetical protein